MSGLLFYLRSSCLWVVRFRLCCWLGLRCAGLIDVLVLILSCGGQVLIAVRKRFILLFGVLLFLSPSLFAWPDKYDHQIRKAARHYLPFTPWQMYKAQLIKESSLNTLAVSPVGAEGLAQFMSGTWRDVSRQLGLVGSPMDAEIAIPAGAYYMSSLRNMWRWPRPEEDRYNLALACYNAGCGNILKAQKLCDDASLYEPIMACLPLVTGRHAVETLGYAPRIRKIYRGLMYE